MVTTKCLAPCGGSTPGTVHGVAATEFGSHLRSEWSIDPRLSYLNHGTVGATPNRVLAAASALVAEIERDPATFQLRRLVNHTGQPWPQPSLIRQALVEVAAFVGADVGGLAFVDNITAGANIVLRSFPLARGDEILVTSMGYGGITRAAMYAAKLAGAHVMTVDMPPLGSEPEAFADAIADAITDRTRLAIIDHLAPRAALLLPLVDIASVCHHRGVAVLADGAHVPGGLPLDIEALGVDFYTANLHKWAWVPRSSGILWAAPEHRATTRPLVMSWGLDNGWEAEFDLPGTRDPVAHLCAPTAIALFDEWGLEAVTQHNHDLVWWAARHLSDAWGTRFDTPECMIAQMATVRLPERFGNTEADGLALQARLRHDHWIEVPVASGVVPDCLTMRLSAQIYVDRSEFEALAKAVDE